MATAAPTCRAVLSQASDKYPGRSTASDGILASRAHTAQNPYSDHELGNAVDLTHDPAKGCDAHAWVRWLVKQKWPEVKYCISNGQIWSKARASEGWRDYDGPNAHTKHAHVSIYDDYRNSNRSWFPVGNTTTSTAGDFKMDSETKTQLAAMMRDSESRIMTAVRKELDEAVLAITGGVRKRDADGNVIDPDPNHVSNADLLTKSEGQH